MIYVADYCDETMPVLMRFKDDEIYSKFKELAKKEGWDLGYFVITDQFHGIADRECKLIDHHALIALEKSSDFTCDTETLGYCYALD